MIVKAGRPGKEAWSWSSTPRFREETSCIRTMADASERRTAMGSGCIGIADQFRRGHFAAHMHLAVRIAARPFASWIEAMVRDHDDARGQCDRRDDGKNRLGDTFLRRLCRSNPALGGRLGGQLLRRFPTRYRLANLHVDFGWRQLRLLADFGHGRTEKPEVFHPTKVAFANGIEPAHATHHAIMPNAPQTTASNSSVLRRPIQNLRSSAGRVVGPVMLRWPWALATSQDATDALVCR